MKVVGTILYGSNNYRLNTPESDRDYKIIVTPNFDELYSKKDLNGATVLFGDPEHYSCMDVRNFAALLAKGNPNAIEMLYSVEQHICESLRPLIEHWRILYRHKYISKVWPNFVDAVAGMMYNGFKSKGNTPKTLSRAIYFYRLIETIYMDDGVIVEDTWRNDYCCDLAKRVRANQAEIFMTPEDILNKIKETRQWEWNVETDVLREDFIIPTKTLVRKYM